MGGRTVARLVGAIVTVDPSLPVGYEVRSRTGPTLVPELSGLADVGFRMVLDGESRSGSRVVCKSMLSRYDSWCIALQA